MDVEVSYGSKAIQSTFINNIKDDWGLGARALPALLLMG